jgi:hypothetical protein
MLLIAAVIILILVAVVVWNAKFSPSAAWRTDVDQAFQMVKLETYKKLTDDGMDGRQAAALTNEVFDARWRGLAAERARYRQVPDRRAAIATVTSAGLAVVEKDHPGTIAFVAADLKQYDGDWLTRTSGI